MGNKLTKRLENQFADFLEQHPPKTFRRELLQLLLEYVENRTKIGFPVGFDKTIWAMQDLFQLFDLAEDEQKK